MRSMFYLLILVCILFSSSALAAEQYTLPNDIAAVFDDEQWDGYQPVFPTWYTVESGYENGAFYPVIMQKDSVNVLCVLEKQDGAWAVAFTNEHALYPGNSLPNRIEYYCDPDAEDFRADYMQHLTISYVYDPPVDDIEKVNHYYAVYSGIWKLREIQIFHPVTPGSYVGGLDYRETNIIPSDDELIYRNVLNEKDMLPDQVKTYDDSITLEDIDINSIPLSFE